MAAQRYDAVVIGAGQAGVPLSQALARSGRRTALIEHVGGRALLSWSPAYSRSYCFRSPPSLSCEATRDRRRNNVDEAAVHDVLR